MKGWGRKVIKGFSGGGVLMVLLALAACATAPESASPELATPEPAKHWDVTHPGKYTLRYYTTGPGDMTGTVRLTVGEREFYVPDDATRPSAQSMYLLSHWKVKEGEEVLDIGTGSGVQAVFAAENAERVVATDISQVAVETATANVKRNGFDDKVDVRLGDLFEPVKDDERFDVILLNIDYPFQPGTEGLWKVHERFFEQVSNYLKPGGRVYYEIGLVENIARVHEMATKNRLRIVSLRMDTNFQVRRQPIVFVLFKDTDIDWGVYAPGLDY